MNEFKFKIPDKLKQMVKDGKVHFSISYFCEDNNICKQITIYDNNNRCASTWDIRKSSISFEEWFDNLLI